MRVAFFLTGHGFGHGVRNSALIEALPPKVDVDIYTSLPASFFKEELHRPYRLYDCEIDCGCLQTDTVEVDVEGTLMRYAELDAKRDELIQEFSQAVAIRSTDLIIGDIPPLAFPIAKAAGVSAWSSCNFDWVDIYRPYLDQFPHYGDMVSRMEEDYRLAQKRIRFYPFMNPRDEVEKIEEIGLICRPGQDKRKWFAQQFGLDIDKKWCLIYVGSFGLEGVAWNRLREYSDWEFIGLYPLHGAPLNYHHIEKNLSYRYADLTASVDLVLGKLGYGLVAECMAMGKPVLFLGRNGFSEYAMLKNILETRKMGLEIPLNRFLEMDFGDDLKSLLSAAIAPTKAHGVGQFMEKMGFSERIHPSH